MADNYFNYYSEIEGYFVRKRGKNLLISPLDWCLIEVWKESEIPLHIVFRGIDRSFETAGSKGKKNPTTLHYCHPAVIEAFEEYKAATIGKSGEDEGKDVSKRRPDEPSEEQIIKCLKQIRKELHKSEFYSPEEFERAEKRLVDLENELSDPSGLTPGDVDRELASISTDLVDCLFMKMDEDKKLNVEAELKEELKIYKRRLSKEMFRRLSVKHRIRKLLNEFDLPEFSLLGFDF